MSLLKSVYFLICLISGINTEISIYQEHPVVQNIKKILESKQVSEECDMVLQIFIKKLGEEIWAFEMLDATSKVPTWLGSYNYVDLGHFSQCIELESIRDNIKGQYCIGNVAINASMSDFYKATLYKEEFKQLEYQIFEGKDFMSHSLTWSICLPSNCSNNDASIIMNKLQLFGFGLKNVYCQTIEDVNPKWTRDGFIGISILGILTFIILISTSYDIYWHKKKAHPGLIAFSLYTNGRKLCKIPKRSSNLSCLDGIRVLSMIWIVIVHTCCFYFSGPVFSSKDNENLHYYIITRIFMKGHLACDTFLIVGGTLVTYVYFKKFKGKNLTFPGILKHYFHRYIRLTPPLAGLVLVYATLLRYMGSGPMWSDSVKSFEDCCKTNWWYQLLYIQNQIQDQIVCTGYTWYLDVDMQLYIFSPLIFWLLSKYTKTGFIILIIATLSSISISFFIAYENELSAIQPLNPYAKTPHLDYFNKYYVKTQARAAPWIIGTILGYILTQKTFTRIHLSKKITIPLWILTFSVILLCIFIGFDSLRGPEYYKLPNAFHIALIRPSFALAIGWIIWACFTNHGGIVNSILSLQIFQFMNKFILSMYLIHPLCLYIIVQSSKTSLYISNFNLVYWFWGVFMFTFGLSIIWILVFESPVPVLEKIIFSSKSQKEEFGKPETKAKDKNVVL